MGLEPTVLSLNCHRTFSLELNQILSPETLAYWWEILLLKDRTGVYCSAVRNY